MYICTPYVHPPYVCVYISISAYIHPLYVYMHIYVNVYMYK